MTIFFFNIQQNFHLHLCYVLHIYIQYFYSMMKIADNENRSIYIFNVDAYICVKKIYKKLLSLFNKCKKFHFTVYKN